MIVCREVIAILDAYVDESLDREHRAEVDRHLVECVSCVAYLASYRETIRMARAAIEDVPPEVITAILATLARNTPRT